MEKNILPYLLTNTPIRCTFVSSITQKKRNSMKNATAYFNFLVSEACAPESDLPAEFIGLLLFAQENADTTDIKQFVDWLEGETMYSKINTRITSPSDFFECAEGKTWDEMEEYYLSNRPRRTEPHW